MLADEPIEVFDLQLGLHDIDDEDVADDDDIPFPEGESVNETHVAEYKVNLAAAQTKLKPHLTTAGQGSNGVEYGELTATHTHALTSSFQQHETASKQGANVWQMTISARQNVHIR